LHVLLSRTREVQRITFRSGRGSLNELPGGRESVGIGSALRVGIHTWCVKQQGAMQKTR
jgi:hypothetical protein